MEKLSFALILGSAVLAGCASLETPPPATAVMSGPPAAAAASDCDNVVLQQSLLQRINAVRTTAQVCSEQPVPAAKPVRWQPALAAAAATHSSDMARRQLFGHRGSDGSLVEARVRRQGYTPLAAGESIAAGDYDADTLVNTWLGNERHCRTLMNPAYTEVGASCVRQPNSQWGTYWTMVMGNRSEPVRRATAAAVPARAKPAQVGKAKSPVKATARAKAKPRIAAPAKRPPIR